MKWARIRGWPLATAIAISLGAAGLLVFGFVNAAAPPLITAGVGLALLAIGLWRGSRLAWQVAPIVASALFVSAVMIAAFITAGPCSHPPCFPFVVYAIPLALGLLSAGVTVGIVQALRPPDSAGSAISVQLAAIVCLWLASAFLLGVAVWGSDEHENALAGYLSLPMAVATALALIAVGWTRHSSVARWLAGVAGLGGLLGSIGLAFLTLGAGCAIAGAYAQPPHAVAFAHGGTCFAPILLPLMGAGVGASIVVLVGVLRPDPDPT